MRIAWVALALSVAALAVAVSSLMRDQGGADGHRCGVSEAGVISCVSGDTPLNYRERGCAPGGTAEGIIFWGCARP
jgi:hypothetical protein